MITPKIYKKNLQDGVITPAMLEDVLYSYNKRAKNWRNKERKYREKKRWNYYYHDKYQNEDRALEKKEMLYEKKSDILSLCSDYLVCIHKVSRTVKVRIEDCEEEFYSFKNEIQKYEMGEKSDVVYKNTYYDKDIEDYITFINVLTEVSEYYLYYKFTNHSFHSPIDIEDLDQYKHLDIVEIDSLTTYGENIKNILSLQFCDKVWVCLMAQKKG